MDDHTLIREGLRTLLDQIDHFDWIAEFNHPSALMEALRARMPVDIVLIDVFYNRENRMHDIGRMASQYLGIKWMILSAYESQALVQQAFSLGISAYLRKDVTLEELKHALQRTWAGKKNLNYTGVSDGPAFAPQGDTEPLSVREKEIIGLIVKGRTEQQIAESLFISKHTVHTHRKNILKKLGLHSNADILKYFIENNLG
ncbi:MAG TPA: response regulator transcription factor [Saprospiraceae bacterium]|nr:response regulator transcription factor [Saprospiraceae bacterium]HNT22276.1 response regulator transcription factor [Saprospiraceae bacterium]